MVSCGHTGVNKVAKQEIVETGARLPYALNQKVQEYAKEVGISKNAVILLAIKQYLEQQELV